MFNCAYKCMKFKKNIFRDIYSYAEYTGVIN